MTDSTHPVSGGLVQDRRSRNRSGWHTVYPRILAGLAIVTLVLGTIGHFQYLSAVNTYATSAVSDSTSQGRQDLPAPAHDKPTGVHLWLDSLYFTIQLFVLNSVFETPPVPALHVARWTAAGVSFGAVGYAVTAFLLLWVGRIRIRRWKDHYIICGLGHWTIALIKELYERKKKVVVIEKNPRDELIPTCTQRGIPVIIGDATTEAILGRASLRQATCLIAFSNDDGTNIEITLAARRLLQSSPAENRPLTCYTQVVDRELMQTFEHHVSLGEPGGSLDVQLFNSYEIAARQAVAEAISHVTTEQLEAVESVHLILLGLSPMGESVVLQAVRNFHFGPHQSFKVTVVEPNRQAVDAFFARYPALPELCAYRAEIGTGVEQTIRGLITDAVCDPKQLVFLAVCFAGDKPSLDSVLRLPRDVLVRGVPIYLWLSSPIGLPRVLESAVGRDTGLPGEIRPFGLPEQCAGPDAIMRPELDAVAKAIHDDYRTERLRQALEQKGMAFPDTVDELESHISQHFDLRKNLAMLPWEILREEYRNSNRQQADHLPFKLLSVDWYAAKEPSSPDDKRVDFSKRTEELEKAVELLAEIEHRRWIAERRLAGWVLGEKRDAELRQSPHLVPWEKLEDNVRVYDRQVIEALPRQLERVGLKLYQRPKRP